MSKKGENIFKRKDGRWEARYIHHYENGIAKYKFIYGRTYTEAKQKRLEHQKSSDMICGKENYRFLNVCEEWLKSTELYVRESTYSKYKLCLKNYLYPLFGGLDLKDMSAEDINFKISKLSKGQGKGSLAPKTLSDIICILKQIIKFSNQKGISDFNTDLIFSLKRDKKQTEIFDKQDFERLKAVLWNSADSLNSGILLTVYSGLRIGELCGLKWEDINFSDRTLTVKRTVERIKNPDEAADKKTKIIISPPKTGTSYRTIPIQDFLIEKLKKAQKSENCYILSGTISPTEPHRVYMKYKKLLKENNIKDHTFHCLRHTFATLAAEKGFDAKSLSEILGHSNISTTLSFYIHPSLEQKRMLMEKIPK